jgi:hypothetical protein
MTRPRASIAGLMLGVAIAAFPLALLGSVLAGRPMLGLAYTLDMGVLPGVTALGIGLARIVLRRGRCGPFAAGFQVAGWSAVIAYVACCRLLPDFMNIPWVYYVNEIEPYILDADDFTIYALSLMIGGFLWGTPQLLFALGGGGLASLAARLTIVLDSRSPAAEDPGCPSTPSQPRRPP